MDEIQQAREYSAAERAKGKAEAIRLQGNLTQVDRVTAGAQRST